LPLAAGKVQAGVGFDIILMTAPLACHATALFLEAIKKRSGHSRAPESCFKFWGVAAQRATYAGTNSHRHFHDCHLPFICDTIRKPLVHCQLYFLDLHINARMIRPLLNKPQVGNLAVIAPKAKTRHRITKHLA